MAVSLTLEVLPTALFPQGDARDPLGVWGFRQGMTGDATGGSIKVAAFVAAALVGAYVYTCYSLSVVQTTGTPTAAVVKSRLLTTWPNVDPDAGVAGYAAMSVITFGGAATFTAPLASVVDAPLLNPLDRFILMFDPRSRGGSQGLVELELSVNTDAATYSFEGYGYFWDRSVMNTPGGPRHPGAS